MITSPPRRALAFAVDWVLANMICGLALPVVFALSADPMRVSFVLAPILTAAAMLMLALLNHGNTPGKRWLKLAVSGAGASSAGRSGALAGCCWPAYTRWPMSRFWARAPTC
ncbi:hypothetical protein E4Z66_09365 [Aliishimia ponticola]|uniref:RDD domain-containing protein n=1 Tax=Aliishimia ponticola TaxID=2499833 RepID=A0A4S4NLS0_9RHOB|nr:RDD family protein [Aliishimia ponticola]THH37130.1 hypothetical protein E4Z66_09365 [Aliishimia ponticola]